MIINIIYVYQHGRKTTREVNPRVEKLKASVLKELPGQEGGRETRVSPRKSIGLVKTRSSTVTRTEAARAVKIGAKLQAPQKRKEQSKSTCRNGSAGWGGVSRNRPVKATGHIAPEKTGNRMQCRDERRSFQTLQISWMGISSVFPNLFKV